MNSTTFIIISLITTFLAYLIKGIAGFGPSLIVVPIFSIFIDIKDAVIIAALADFLSSLVLTIKGFKSISWKHTKRIGIGLLTGTLIGVSIFKAIDTIVLKKLLGAFILIYLISPYFTRNLFPKTRKINKFWGIILGLVGGVCGGLINTNGPPVVIYMNNVLNHKEQMRPTLAFLFLIDSIWRISLLALNNMISQDTINFFISSVIPTLLLGMFAAFHIDKKVCNKKYDAVIRSILLVSGLNLILF